MLRRKMTATMQVLGVIDANMHREFDGDSFKSATFELSDGIYKVDSQFNVRKLDNAGDIKELPIHYCKGGIYPEVYISGMPIKAYVLSMIAQDEKALEKYQSGMEINHCVISKVYPKTLNIGCNNFYEKEVIISTAPLKKLSADPNYLEFCTRGENVRHGKFVKDFSLYNTYVSARDIDELRKVLIPYDPSFCDRQDDWIRWNRASLDKFYRDRGETKQILF